jgi:DNA-binding beta-propeller fold protein YncE
VIQEVHDRMKRRAFLPVAVLLIIFLAVLGGSAAAADGAARPRTVRIGETIVYELSAGESEVVDVASSGDGSRIYVVAPASAKEGIARSSIVELVHAAGDEEGPREVAAVDLGPGEATSVAAHPSGLFAVAVLKDARRPDLGAGSLAIVEGGKIAASLPIGPGPDSVAISPDGKLAVAACEAQPPDDDDEAGTGERPEDDLPGTIHIVDLSGGPRAARVAAVVTGEAMYERIRREPDRAASAREIEPEFVAIAPDSSYALVTLQEQSAVAVVDLAGIRKVRAERPETAAAEIGRRALLDVVLLPHGFTDTKGVVRGTHPDGIAISPDGTFAVTANEAHPKARHLQGISFLDLRKGPGRVRVAGEHSVFDLDPSLKSEAKAPERKVVKKKGKAASKKPVRLPRLDPEGVAIGRRGDAIVVALAIERQGPAEDAGSVLFLDPAGALDGGRPARIARRLVGANEGARPETLRFSREGGFLYVASERDGGTLSVIEVR